MELRVTRQRKMACVVHIRAWELGASYSSWLIISFSTPCRGGYSTVWLGWNTHRHTALVACTRDHMCHVRTHTRNCFGRPGIRGRENVERNFPSPGAGGSEGRDLPGLRFSPWAGAWVLFRTPSPYSDSVSVTRSVRSGRQLSTATCKQDGVAVARRSIAIPLAHAQCTFVCHEQSSRTSDPHPSFSSMSGIPHTVCGVSRHKERALRFLRPIEYQPSSRFLRIGRAGSIVSHLQYGSKARRMGSRAGARSLWSSSQIRQSTLFGKRTVLCQHLAGSSTTIPHTEAGRTHTRQLRKIALMADCMCCIGMA